MRQPVELRRNYGTTDRASRLTAHSPITLSTLSTAKHNAAVTCRLVVLWSRSLRSTSEAAGGLCRNYGTTESRIDGIMELRKGQVGSKLIAHSPITLSTLSTFYTL